MEEANDDGISFTVFPAQEENLSDTPFHVTYFLMIHNCYENPVDFPSQPISISTSLTRPLT